MASYEHKFVRAYKKETKRHKAHLKKKHVQGDLKNWNSNKTCFNTSVQDCYTSTQDLRICVLRLPRVVVVVVVVVVVIVVVVEVVVVVVVVFDLTRFVSNKLLLCWNLQAHYLKTQFKCHAKFLGLYGSVHIYHFI